MVFSVDSAFFCDFLKKDLQFVFECVYYRFGNALSHGVAMIFWGWQFRDLASSSLRQSPAGPL